MVGFYWDMQWKKDFNIKKGIKRDIEKILGYICVTKRKC